jgi:hypothetical protein
MGTEEEVKEHEPKCTDNYDRRSCYTCVHKQSGYKDKQWCYECKLGKEITVGTIYEFCPQYEKREAPYTVGEALFGNWFNFGL